MASFQATPHPILGVPTPAQAREMGEAKWRKLMTWREEIIAAERVEPFDNLWEPPIWRVCDALLGLPWVPKEEAEQIRQRLGFARRVSTLLINGAQRGGKTQYSCSRVMRILRMKAGRRAWMLHENMEMSREYHQAPLYHYLPSHLRAENVRDKTAYIAYKQKTGFSEASFVLPAPEGEQGSQCTFKAYEQDMHSVQGGNLDIISPDELVPIEWVNEMRYRIAERDGWMIITFTPVQGYSPTVKEFQDGATTALEVPAYLLPNDGGEPDLARQLGLTPEELKELYAADEARPPRAAYYPQARPDPLGAILADSQLPIANSQEHGRSFEMVPRVLRCVDPERAVVFFHLGDNPYGNPKGVWAKMKRERGAILERAYGVATKNMTARFAKFRRCDAHGNGAHVIPPDNIPKEGTNYLIVDPCNGRNFMMKWYRVTPERSYLYREWPGNYHIPDIGVPGPWALPDGKVPDGRRGPAQMPFGWGLRRYKLELARLEGWSDYLKGEPPNLTKEEREAWIDGLDPMNGAREHVQERFLDSRFASTPQMTKDRPKTLITEFEEIGLFFTPTPGDDIEEGCTLIDAALDYDTNQPVSALNQPKFQVSADCENSIFALLTWTGRTKEGRRDLDGATKDPIDCDRYFFLGDCTYSGGRVDDRDEDEEEEFERPPGARRHY
jgi:phage terminase large subunit-like protein